MKKILVLTLLSISLAAVAACKTEQGTTNTSETNATPAVETQTYRSVGVVTAVDRTKQEVTVDHEDIPGYMAPMEMTEAVGDTRLLDAVKAGDKVNFEIVRVGSKVVYTKFEKVGEVTAVPGRETYLIGCAECHGAQGEGAEKGIPFTSGHALHHTERDFIRTVTNGKSLTKDKPMPAFGKKLSEAEIAIVVRYVRGVIQKDAKPMTAGHDH